MGRRLSWEEREENRKNAELKKKHNISFDEYKKMSSMQDGRCAICNKKEDKIHLKSKKTQALSVDHCHISGNIRGLLCASCNLGLGSFKDNVEYLKRAAWYLENYDTTYLDE